MKLTKNYLVTGSLIDRLFKKKFDCMENSIK